MGLMCLLEAHLLKCRSSLCLHLKSRLLLSCFYIASLWLLWFHWVGCRRVVFVLSSLCWSQRLWRGRQIILLLLDFLHIHLLVVDVTERLTTIWKSDKIKREFFQTVAISVLLDDCTIWTLMKCYPYWLRR